MVLSLKTLLCVGCGCFFGGVLRYLTSYFICTRWGITATDMPWHTASLEMRLLDTLGLSEEQKEKLFSGNAKKLLGIE